MASGAERETQSIYDGMCTQLETMQARRDALRAEYESLVHDCDVLEQAVEVMRRQVANSGREHLLDITASVPPGPVSFDGCTNAHQRLVRMAEAWGGIVSCHHAATVLRDAGISKSHHNNLVSSLQKEMASQLGTWKLEGRRTYRYLPYNDPGADVADDSDSDFG